MKFWVDMDNAPHVHVLRPLILELEHRGHTVEITARDYGQTLPLLRLYGLKARCIGRHGGKSKVKKYLFFMTRSVRLLFYACCRRFDAVFTHGARSTYPVARLLNLPIIALGDYEHTAFPRFMGRWIRLLLIPNVIPTSVISRKGIPPDRIVKYPGLKEDLYIHDFEPDASFISDLMIDRDRVLILVRPPATMAHYAVRQSEVIFEQVLEYLASQENAVILILSRTVGQQQQMQNLVHKQGYANVVFPNKVYHGPDLIWYSDLVISGGGKMNREACVLGVPVASIYQGPKGAVDMHLIKIGKLIHIKTIEDIKKLPIVKSVKRAHTPSSITSARLCNYIVDQIIQTAERSHQQRVVSSRNS